MRILIDTNILITLEDSSMVLGESFSELVRLANDNSHQLIVHPSSVDDLKRDKDETRKKINLSRIRKYAYLENPPIPDDPEIQRLGLKNSNENDRVDNEIIYAIYKDAANILVTEDRGIHKKAAALDINGRVHYIQQAVDALQRLHRRVHVALPNIQEVCLHEIDCGLPFFDSLREDYAEFNEWYKESSRQGRKAWVHRDGAEDLGAILIYKEEQDEIVSDDNKALPGAALKLCTFKVGEDIRGRKIGELFLKAAFRYATGNHIEHIYITMRPGKHEFLEDLCVDFGFERCGKFREDYVYVKRHPTTPPAVTDEELSPLEYHKKFYPHFKADENVQKFIVPIKPIFHEMLFPDNQRQRSFFSYSAVGNAIKQAYLCHARISRVSAGDILLFYRSKDMQAITSLGIVEATGEYQNSDEIIPLVSKRTVYSYEEIAAMAKKKTRVILFRLAKHLPKPVRYAWLLKEGVVKGPIQTIRKITNDAFEKIISE